MGKKELDINDKLLEMSEKYKMSLDSEYLDSGSIILNMVLGGGLPMCKNIEIYSNSGYGKSTIVLSICKYLCKQGHRVLYIDAEGSITELIKSMNFYGKYDSKTGEVVVSDTYPNIVWSKDNPTGNFVVIQTSYFEEIESILEKLIPNFDSKGNPIDSEFRLVVIDSVAALSPQEYRGDFGEKDGISIASNKPGIIAKLMTAFCRKFNGYKTAYNMSFIYINQLRDNLSLSYGSKFEDNVPGGRALKFFMDVILKLNSRGTNKNKIENTLGEIQEVETEREVDIKAVKNKITHGGIGFPLLVRFGIGISNIAALPQILPKKKLITKDNREVYMIEGSGAWNTLTFNVKDDKGNILETKSIRCNGMAQLKEAIRNNFKDIYSEINETDFRVLADKDANLDEDVIYSNEEEEEDNDYIYGDDVDE